MTRSLPLILICGDSLLLAGLEASLRRAPGLQVLHLATPALPGEARLPAAGGVVVYDQAEIGLGQLAGWLADCPGLTLLGLDAERDRIHVVTGHSQAVRAVGELTRVVLEAACSDKVTG
jgi:hypothetical protein